MKPSENIREARSLLFERGWNTGAGEGPNGELCIAGALLVACRQNPNDWVGWRPMERQIIEAVIDEGTFSLIGWNDRRGRTFDDVISLLERAEKIAEQRENDGH